MPISSCSLLLHLAATETYYYQMSTFEGKAWDKWPDAVKQKWDIPMNLGEPARKAMAIKGNNLDCYVNILGETANTPWRNFARRTMSG